MGSSTSQAASTGKKTVRPSVSFRYVIISGVAILEKYDKDDCRETTDA